MFEDAEEELKRIIALTEKCPAALQEKCFEILLSAYVSAKAVPAAPPPPPVPPVVDVPPPPPPPPAGAITGMPETIKPRFNAMAARLKVTAAQLAKLFDFQTDPFTFHALAVPGDSKKEKAKNVALLIGAKTYLATGNWTADWKEFRAMCIDQNCYDQNNVQTYLKVEEFKAASATDGITLSRSAGVTAAEALVQSLANPTDDSAK